MLSYLKRFFKKMLQSQKRIVSWIHRLPGKKRVELIDGYFYDMASPTFGHQSIGGEIHRQIANFIVENGGNCRPFIAPVAYLGFTVSPEKIFCTVPNGTPDKLAICAYV